MKISGKNQEHIDFFPFRFSISHSHVLSNCDLLSMHWPTYIIIGTWCWASNYIGLTIWTHWWGWCCLSDDRIQLKKKEKKINRMKEVFFQIDDCVIRQTLQPILEHDLNETKCVNEYQLTFMSNECLTWVVPAYSIFSISFWRWAKTRKTHSSVPDDQQLGWSRYFSRHSMNQFWLIYY